MINLTILQSIVADPPQSVLELYARLCAAHSFTFGDVTRIGKAYASSMAQAPADSVFIDVQRYGATEANDAFLATCFVGETVEGVDSYSAKLGIYIRGAYAGANVSTLKTEILGKRLGTHLANAMGYDDYVLIRPCKPSIIDIDGATGYKWVMPLILPPGVVYEQADPGYYIDAANGQENPPIFGAMVANNASDSCSGITVKGATVRPPAWFYTTENYTAATLPMTVYITDDQCWATVNDAINVMQQAELTGIEANVDDLQSHYQTIDGDISTLKSGFSAVTALVADLSVFGNSVRQVTERYNAITQYIPRP